MQAKSIMFDLNLPPMICHSKTEILSIGVIHYTIIPFINQATHNHRTKRVSHPLWNLFMLTYVSWISVAGRLVVDLSLLVLPFQVWCHRKLNIDFQHTRLKHCNQTRKRTEQWDTVGIFSPDSKKKWCYNFLQFRKNGIISKKFTKRVTILMHRSQK